MTIYVYRKKRLFQSSFIRGIKIKLVFIIINIQHAGSIHCLDPENESLTIKPPSLDKKYNHYILPYLLYLYIFRSNFVRRRRTCRKLNKVVEWRHTLIPPLLPSATEHIMNGHQSLRYFTNYCLFKKEININKYKQRNYLAAVRDVHYWY